MIALAVMLLAFGARVAPTPPALLSQTGLAAAGVEAFAPQYPLWSDGATKRRWVSLPGPITVADGIWQFPVGTRFWKEFTIAGRVVETRMIWRASAADWVFATYVWRSDGSDAERVEEGALVGGHAVPSVDDCRACHEAGPSPVLGFDALQLADARDPLAPHAEEIGADMLTVGALIRSGRLPATVAPEQIAARSARERAALGYLRANCGGCHNASGPLAPLGLDLRAPTSSSALDVPGRWRVPGIAPELSRRVAPGHPEHSALVARMRSRWPASQMPPLGTTQVDREALALIEAWIAEDLESGESDK